MPSLENVDIGICHKNKTHIWIDNSKNATAESCLCIAGSVIPPLGSLRESFLYAKGNSIKLKNLLGYFTV